jgi:hypothetical protein
MTQEFPQHLDHILERVIVVVQENDVVVRMQAGLLVRLAVRPDLRHIQIILEPLHSLFNDCGLLEENVDGRYDRWL